jgi:hypothetical protein
VCVVADAVLCSLFDRPITAYVALVCAWMTLECNSVAQVHLVRAVQEDSKLCGVMARTAPQPSDKREMNHDKHAWIVEGKRDLREEKKASRAVKALSGQIVVLLVDFGALVRRVCRSLSSAIFNRTHHHHHYHHHTNHHHEHYITIRTHHIIHSTLVEVASNCCIHDVSFHAPLSIHPLVPS